MKESTLFILKQVIDEFRTTDTVMDVQIAREFLNQIRGLMLDRKSYPCCCLPSLSP